MKENLRVYVLMIIISLLFILFHLLGTEKVVAWEEYTVRPGDTVWCIAGEKGQKDVDLLKIVYDIKEKNKLSDSVIRPGDTIYIPVYGQ